MGLDGDKEPRSDRSPPEAGSREAVPGTEEGRVRMLVQSDPLGGIDRLLADALRATQSRAMPMDAYQEGAQLVIALDLPGVDPATIAVTVEHGHLSIQAERPNPPTSAPDMLVHERPSGHWIRRVVLSDALDPEAIAAAYERGVLTLRVPFRATTRARRVAIDAPEELPRPSVGR